ncbi:MAG: methyltransferase domain-containing protein [Pyrinomonadaceae bacterium]
MAAPVNKSTNASFENLSSLTAGGVIVDIGTGDGRFVYQSARGNPAKFYVGIDANAHPLEKVSMKATRRPAKGGATNVMFVQAAVEDLPDELNDTADEIHIHFPWGSLLGAILIGDSAVLRGLHRISTAGCLLEVVIGIDPDRDRAELKRLSLPSVSPDYLKNVLAPNYEAAGFHLRESGAIAPGDWSHFECSWARRLKGNDQRQVVYFIAEAQK